MRFRPGDVVVLNGHRASVVSLEGFVHDDETIARVGVLDEKGRHQRVPAPWLPDPEPREDARSRLARFAAKAEVHGFDHALRQTWPGESYRLFLADLRDLTDTFVEGGGERGTSRREAGGEPEARKSASGPATPAPNPDDQRDEWDTFGTKRGVVMADPPLTAEKWKVGDTAVLRGTPGMIVAAHKRDAGAVWFLGIGDDHARFVHPDDLRPVSLVEKPEREATIAGMIARVKGGYGDNALYVAQGLYGWLFSGQRL